MDPSDVLAVSKESILVRFADGSELPIPWLVVVVLVSDAAAGGSLRLSWTDRGWLAGGSISVLLLDAADVTDMIVHSTDLSNKI
jgi:hypothetical protein